MIARVDYARKPRVPRRRLIPDDAVELDLHIADRLHAITSDHGFDPQFVVRKIVVMREDGSWTEYTRHEED